MLNKTQKEAINHIKNGRNVHLYGGAGTGKSVVIGQYLNSLTQSERERTIVCAPTGIAAILVSGSTIHRVFKVDIGVISPQEKPNEKAIDLLENVDRIIIDEISMCRQDLFSYLARTLKACSHKIQLIVVGDFLQLPPVVTDKDRPLLAELYDGFTEGYAFQAKEWDEFHFVNVHLTEIMRQKDNFDFVTNLNKARVGDMSCLEWFASNSANNAKKGAIYLCGKNIKADSINKKKSREFKDFETFTANITGIVSSKEKIVSEEIKLAEGMRVMSVINGEGYQNGSLGTVKSLSPLTVSFDNGQICEISRQTWEMYDYKINEKTKEIVKYVIGTYVQIPLKVAYAITYHKSQGQTYDSVVIEPECFAPGQLYVALSRCKTIENIKINGELKGEYLITSKSVLDFYNKIENSDFVTNSNRGGVRKGAGRKPKYNEKTKTIRVPESMIPEIQEMIRQKELLVN